MILYGTIVSLTVALSPAQKFYGCSTKGKVTEIDKDNPYVIHVLENGETETRYLEPSPAEDKVEGVKYYYKVVLSGCKIHNEDTDIFYKEADFKVRK